MIKTPLSTVIGGEFWTPGATVINGAKLSFETVMKKLFANGEQGFWYDPSDMGTMYQDAAGTVPITAVGQPVGLMLDKSKGLVLGSKIATGFVDGYIPPGYVSEALPTEVLGTKTSNWFPVEPESFYKIYAPISDRCRVQVKNSSGIITYLSNYASASSADGRVLKSNNDSVFMRVYFASETVGSSVTEFGVRKLAGNHAYQTTSSMRPLLVASPQRLDFDIADDKLITNLPAQLTVCTVVRSVPNVGTQILTNQTIPATYNDNTDHCGLIVINRALTPSETSAITAEFNKRAGV
jgi:hypothetical protein